MSKTLMLFSGNSNIDLSKSIAAYLGKELGNAWSTAQRREIRVKINQDVRGRDVFVVQSTCPPPNENLMELLIMIDALRRASASRITAVIPYFGYARQDRKDSPRAHHGQAGREPHHGRRRSRVLTMDLHAGQIQGFFDIPWTSLRRFRRHRPDQGAQVLGQSRRGLPTWAASRWPARSQEPRRVARGLGQAPGERPRGEVMNIIGDVKDKDVLLVDDIVATAGSLVEAAKALKQNAPGRSWPRDARRPERPGHRAALEVTHQQASHHRHHPLRKNVKRSRSSPWPACSERPSEDPHNESVSSLFDQLH